MNIAAAAEKSGRDLEIEVFAGLCVSRMNGIFKIFYLLRERLLTWFQFALFV